MTSQRIIPGDCLAGLRTLPDASVHCCVTSPPYWGLRDYGHDGQIGLESTPEAYVARMVEVFREVRRVLREDGTCWVNLGDSYANQKSGDTYSGFNDRYFNRSTDGGKQAKTVSGAKVGKLEFTGLKPKDLVGIPWRVAFALQADGWWLRQDIIWHKPNPMPESVRDRCTKSHEYVFLLTKSQRYFYDAEAVKEPMAESTFRIHSSSGVQKRAAESGGWKTDHTPGGRHTGLCNGKESLRDGSRNRRSVWTITTKPYSGAHFAVMPPDLVEPCILAGCPEQCCPVCGTGWERVTQRVRSPTRPGKATKVTGASLVDGNRDPQRHITAVSTLGWAPACDCGVAETTTGIVLDPFAGSGTTLAVAAELGRNAIGCELNPEYISLAERRIKEARASVALFEGACA
jgi:DNA modification methylase